MNWSQNRLALAVAVLLVVASALFAVGTAIEHSQRGKSHTEHKAEVSTPAKSSETSTEKTANGEAASPTPAETGGETHSEKIAGIDPESWPLVGVAIALSLLVAAGVYRRRGRWLVAAVVFGVAFAAADTRELVHQIQESRTAVATIAGVLIALHLLAALGGVAARRAKEV
jgi:hypothetical protein